MFTTKYKDTWFYCTSEKMCGKYSSVFVFFSLKIRALLYEAGLFMGENKGEYGFKEADK